LTPGNEDFGPYPTSGHEESSTCEQKSNKKSLDTLLRPLLKASTCDSPCDLDGDSAIRPAGAFMAFRDLRLHRVMRERESLNIA